MRLVIDTASNKVAYESGLEAKEFPLYSRDAFEILNNLWVKVGWNLKYSYSYTWFGRPIIQLPEDLVRMQEVIYQLKPDVVIETGVAHGGSLVFYASIAEAMGGEGRVIGVDIKIRPKNKAELEGHPLSRRLKLIEGDSVAPDTVEAVRQQLQTGKERVLVVLDSCHSSEHVFRELQVYSEFVSQGSYIVVTDGIMRELADTPGAETDWHTNNPLTAVNQFLVDRDDFDIHPPQILFDESLTGGTAPTYWPSCWLRRKF